MPPESSNAGFAHPRGRVRFLLVTCLFLMLAGISNPANAAGEKYTLTVTPNSVQEGAANGVSLSLKVSSATTFTNYSFVWTVSSPSGLNSTRNNSTFTLSNSFVLSTVFPQSFTGGDTRYVGNYSVRVDQITPANKPNVASGLFAVGLTDAKTYQRTSTASIQAIGYAPGENVTIDIRHGTSVTGFPAWGFADSNGQFSYLWQSSPSAPTGVYSVSLRGSVTVKTPNDVQSFTMFPTNVTIPQMTVARTSLQRTETQEFRIAATYLSGVPVQTGSVTIVISEPSSTVHSVTASYNSTLDQFRATYKIPISSQSGTWAAAITANTFSDGFGNGGPSVGLSKAFNVQAASLSVSVSVPNSEFTAGQLIPIYASVTTPDGGPFVSGTVVSSISLSSSASPLGGKVTLQYVASQGKWVGSSLVNSTNPAGIWLVSVNASDSYGNYGAGSVITVVNVPPIQPSNSSISLLYFAIAAAAIGTGAGTTLFMRRFNSVDAPFEELYKLTGGELQPPTTLMIRGESGTGTTTLGLELVYQKLNEGKQCGILTYNSFPSEVQRLMKGMGWNVDAALKDGRLKFLDCYTAIVGGEAPIKDPVDFTEVSIQVSEMVDSAKGPVTVLLDSFTPIFNSAQPRHAINFLRVLGAKIKNDGGIFIMTGTRGSLPEAIESTLDSIVDGIIDLRLVRKGKSLLRFLIVKKVAGREITSTETEFKIRSGKGILFKRPRINSDFFRQKLAHGSVKDDDTNA